MAKNSGINKYFFKKLNKKIEKNNNNYFKANNRKRSGFNIFNHKWKILCAFACILGFLIYATNGFTFNKGIDFTGGLVVEASCDKCNKGNKIVEQIKKKLKLPINYQKIENGYLFKTNITDNHDQILNEFSVILKQNDAKIVTTNFSSPQITKTFVNDSIFACIFAFVCIGLYIVIRFNWKIAMSAIVTLVVDILMVVSFISIKQIEVCLITLTAVLTIIGYNINDKIVVFDCIRGNLDLTNMPIPEIIKKSIKNVLFRSVLTSVTTIIVAISTLFFGDRAIYELGLIIIYGIIVGTISSLLLAPNLLLAFNIKHKQKQSIIREPMWYAS